jgi:hypothetical protein
MQGRAEKAGERHEGKKQLWLHHWYRYQCENTSVHRKGWQCLAQLITGVTLEHHLKAEAHHKQSNQRRTPKRHASAVHKHVAVSEAIPTPQTELETVVHTNNVTLATGCTSKRREKEDGENCGH